MRDDMSEANARIDHALQQLAQRTGDPINDLDEFIRNLDAAADAALLPPDPPRVPIQRTGMDGCE